MVGVLLLALTGCDDDRIGDSETGQERLKVGVSTTVSTPLSRVVNITSDNINTFGMMVNLNAGGNWSNESYVSRMKNDGVWSLWDLSPQQTWPNLTNTVEVVAYAPYQDPSLLVTVNATKKLTFSANTEADSEPVDWLYYYSGKIVITKLTDASGVVPVKFNHIMSRLRVEVGVREELKNKQISTVEVLGTLPGGEFNIATSATITTTGAVTPIYATNTGEATGVWSTYLVPQAIQAGMLKIRVTLDNAKSYTYPYEASQTFATARAYKLSLLLGRDKLELTPDSDGITVTDWEEGDDISGGKAEEEVTK